MNRSRHLWNKRALRFFVLIILQAIVSNDGLSSFKNLTKEARLLRNEILRCPNELSRYTYCIGNKGKSPESQIRSPSHRFTSKSKQTFSLESTRKRTTIHWVWHPRVVRGAMHSGKNWRSVLWLNAMHSDKKWWIREFVLPSIFLVFIFCYNYYAHNYAWVIYTDINCLR